MSVSQDLKKRLSDFLIAWVNEQPGSQTDRAGLLSISQPRLSDLLKGKIDRFSIEALIDLLYRAGFVFSMVSEDDILTVKIVKI